MEIPSGLKYYKNVISSELENEILDYFDKNLDEEYVVKTKDSRKVRQYGYKYNYDSKDIGEKVKSIPDVLTKLLTLLPNEYKEIKFDQCIVNKYKPGQGISAHIDHRKFGPVIACFSICGDTNIKFKHIEREYLQFVEGKSLYIMKNDARYKWTHEISPTLTDTINNKMVRRTTRYSITFRTIA